MVAFAEEATMRGNRVLSFDLPEHGARKDNPYPCKVQHCVRDLELVVRHARSLSNEIGVFACSMGAYFSLLAYSHESLKQCLFLSPVTDMARIIDKMMGWFGVTEARLEAEQEIPTPIGQTLYWDYYCYVKAHPIVTWAPPTSILYGSADALCEFDEVSEFAKRFHCDLQVMERGEHYFHTAEQLHFFRQWLRNSL